MASRGSQRERDPDLDDWFAESDFAPRRRPSHSPRSVGEDEVGDFFDSGQADDDWLDRGPGRDELPLRPGRLDLSNPRLWLAAGAVVLLALLGLYLGGVFNSSPKAPTAPTLGITTQQVTTPPRTTPRTTTKTTKVALPTTALKSGDTGLQVKRLQRSLAALGYSPGTVDGRYGPATKRAVELFQKAKKLTVDGILGPKTLKALQLARG